ncbi:1-deoxy-D-xylulose-5-phosphate reductoisomerase [Moraxella caviae]|uniref:1-deoxy-D-xylulose 5-phosphate reductoisomerase n=1 Tax=Moraxella caviae TaxID=34060 RepID=A0A1T0A2K7_9GAMM|nr:1-deoxy-D-xylulose-5-phosphate reductoisomerase [Moraxella caviae]OOR89935.1 1-deoxy-D-xylulose-5-phosphate reductoisomerase [Moraxella caviae]STZ14320.1 1-deoxy-D-xylulose 5-phosphate reductoisomerase [Moraxella caviae]
MNDTALPNALPDLNCDDLAVQNLAVLGATGSIGDSTLALVRAHRERFCVVGLSGFGQLDKLFALCQEFRPQMVAVPENKAAEFDERLQAAGLDTRVLSGSDGLDVLASAPQVDTVVAAIVGAAGLSSTLSAAKAGKKILLANKESLVMAGHLVMAAARTHGAVILPIDSEHNAIFQCLPPAVQADNKAIHRADLGVKQLWLTASGGGFLRKTYAQMAAATAEQAVNHPNWSMGKKISIDSATMMNKGLELIEACHLFDLPEHQVQIVIHPNSVVHSLVEYVDGSLLAELGTPDMRTPIAHALSFPSRMTADVKPLNLFELASLEFIKPDEQKFLSLVLARFAAKCGTGACITLNAANEVAVQAFLDGRIRLTDIAQVVGRCLIAPEVSAHFDDEFADLPSIMAMDSKVRTVASTMIDGFENASFDDLQKNDFEQAFERIYSKEAAQ